MNTGGHWKSRKLERGSFRGRGGNRGGSNWRGRSNFRGNQDNRGHCGGGAGDRHENFKNQDKQSWKVKPKRETPGKRLSEEQIGVTEYISDHEGFMGIIKSRYSDFQVAEINDQGEVAQLTDTSPPKPPAEKDVVEDEDLLISKYNLEILPTETWDGINRLVMGEATQEVVEIDVTEVSKEQRTKIHEAVKKAFGACIVGSTVNINEKKLIRFGKYQKGVRIDNRVKWVWPGEYVHFIVHKENCDTMDAAQRITERLRLNLKPSMLGYAGTKDRRAKTSQWFSLRKVDPGKVAAACRDLRDIHVGNFSFKPHQLRLGMLSGNEFRIALRNVTVPIETINKSCELLKENGFINYYGLQRFGTRVDIPTYQIGLKLLKGNFKEAIDDILAERPGLMEKAFQAYREGGPAAALRLWPKRSTHYSMEHRMLKALASCPGDLLGALDKLARNTRLLYLHSYQSLVWNRAASERLRRLPRRPAPGDLVPRDTHIPDPVDEIDLMDDDEEDSESAESESTESTEAADKAEVKPETNADSKQQETGKRIPVKVLTQEDVDSGKYSIFDIILPLPGHAIEYPPNMKQFYVDELEKDGLTPAMKHKYKSYVMSGAYRHLVVRPVNMTWNIARYTDPTADLILSDWDVLQGRQLDGIIDDGKYAALLLSLSLPASCYATMALRELLRTDTAADAHAMHNQYHVDTETKPQAAENVKKEPEEIKAEGQNIHQQKTEQETKPEILEHTKEESQTEKRKIENDSADIEVKKLKVEDKK